MQENVTFQINIAGNVFAGVGTLHGDFQQLVNVVGQVDNSVNQTFNNLKNKIQSINLNAVINQVKEVSAGIAGISSPGIGFGQDLADLSAITDIVGNDLVDLGKLARQTGRDSGLGASEAAKAYNTIASQIEVDGIGMDGLKELQQNAIILAHASGMALSETADALAGTINQFEYGANQADRVINVLAAGSKVGAAEIEHLTQSFKVVGSQASIAGVSIEETTGALEVLSRSNIKGSEAGTHLRNIILSLQTVFGADLKNMTLSDALDQLKPKLEDATFMSQNFGRMSMAAAQFLVKNSDAVKDLTDKVTGTSTAHEQAAIRTDTVQQMMARCRARVDDLKIGFFELTGSFGGYATIVSEQAVTIAQLLPLLTLVGKGIMFITSAQKLQALWSGIVSTATTVWTGVQNILNASLWACPLTWIIAAVVGLIAVIAICVTKVEGWGRQWDSVVKFMKLSGELFVETIKFKWNTMIDGIMIGLDYIKLGWYKFKEAVGLGDSASNQEMIAKISADVERRKQDIADGAQRIVDLAKEAKEALTWELSWKKSEDQPTEAGALSTTVPIQMVPELGGDALDGSDQTLDLSGKRGRGRSSTRTTPVDLNEIVPNLKGSTAYSAIAARMAPLDISQSAQPAPANNGSLLGSLTRAAAAVALPLVMPLAMEATTMPQDVPTREQYAQTEYHTENNRRSVTMQKFCDNIVIHVANTDNKGKDEIRKEVMAVFEEMFDDYA